MQIVRQGLLCQRLCSLGAANLPLRCKALDRSASVYLFNKCYRILALENHTVLTASITDSLLLASRLHPTVAYTGSIRIKSAIRLLRQTKNNSAQSIARRFAVYWSVIHDIDHPPRNAPRIAGNFCFPPEIPTDLETFLRRSRSIPITRSPSGSWIDIPLES
jgi:hypothetical protein